MRDLSIYSFVRGLALLQFEGKQKTNKLIGKHSLVIDMRHICPRQPLMTLLVYFLTIVIKSDLFKAFYIIALVV